MSAGRRDGRHGDGSWFGRAAPHWQAGTLCLLVAPGLPLLAHQSGNTAATAWITAPTLADVQAVAVNMVSRFTTMPAVVGLCAGALVLLGLVALAGDLGQPDGRRTALFVLCVTVAPFGLPLLLSAVRPVFLTQSVVTTTFGLMILFARGAAWLAGRFGRWALLVLAPVLLLNAASITTIAATPINEDWRGAALYLRQQATPTDVLIFDPRFLQLPFDLYWHGYGRSNPERGYLCWPLGSSGHVRTIVTHNMRSPHASCGTVPIGHRP